MPVYKKGKGWTAEVKDKRGNYITSKGGFPTKMEARKWEAGQKKQYDADPKYMQKQSYSFDQLMDKYQQEHLPTCRYTTQERYLLDLRNRIIPEFKYTKLENITAGMVSTFRSKIMDGLSSKSVNNCVDLLRSIFRLAKDWGMMDRNPCTLKPLKVPVEDYIWWEEWADVQRFLEATRNDPVSKKLKYKRYGNRDPYAAAYRLALECGLREGEITGLSKSDVNLETCTVRIHRQWITSRNVTKKPHHFGPPKHNKVRTVGFQPDSPLREMLRSVIDASSDPEIIFITREGQRLRNNKLMYYFQKWIDRLELPQITFHDLRHTFASWYMIRYDNIWELMEILGHSDVKTTLRYAHLSQKVKRVPNISEPPVGLDAP